MTSKDHARLVNRTRYGRPAEQEVAWATRKADAKAAADKQNAKEACWSLKKLCEVIRREGNGGRLTPSQRHAKSPVVIPGEGEIVRVYNWYDCGCYAALRRLWRKPLSATTPFYTGPLCDYWRTLLADTATTKAQADNGLLPGA